MKNNVGLFLQKRAQLNPGLEAFIDTFAARAEEELTRKQHFSDSVEYRAYRENIRTRPDMWCRWSEKYISWRQLEILGLMSKGNWA